MRVRPREIFVRVIYILIAIGVALVLIVMASCLSGSAPGQSTGSSEAPLESDPPVNTQSPAGMNLASANRGANFFFVDLMHAVDDSVVQRGAA